MDTAATILIADDEPLFRIATIELLRCEGYACDGAATADEAIALLRCRRYDLLIADVRMPGNREFRVVRQARQLSPGLPVLLITGYPSMDTAVEAAELPIFAHLTKPMEFDVLLEHIRAALAAGPEERRCAP